ncbi:hypothetical protein, partial [Neisseria mucosa]|uniref:hypothetical protein n=1 Tax=Neisseria mucosa TaxID=488 RepID=UPI00280B02B7
GAHGKSPKCLGGNLGDFGEFCKGLRSSENFNEPVFLFSDDLHLYLNKKGRNRGFFLLYLKPNT